MSTAHIEYEESDDTDATRKLELCFMCATKRAMEVIIAGKQTSVRTSIVTNDPASFSRCADCKAYFN